MQSNKKKSTKHTRKIKYQNKLRRHYNNNAYFCSIYLSDYDNEETSRVIKDSYGRSKYVRFFKKYSNKKIRRYKGEMPNGNFCKKIFDFWWEID